jgi:hypothetical protein
VILLNDQIQLYGLAFSFLYKLVAFKTKTTNSSIAFRYCLIRIKEEKIAELTLT